MRNILFTASLLAGLSVAVYGQTRIPAFISDSLDSYINKAMREWRVPGVAVAIVRDGKIVLVKGYGKQSISRDDKVDKNTLFMIGSNTKAFTATTLALLENDKKCLLSDKVVRWLPDFRMKDPWVTRELNLTDILCHRMGMETFQGDFMYWTSDLTRGEVIQKFGMLTPVYEFRTKWGYTNAGFGIAGECIRSISGETWESTLRNRILTPLEMKRTTTLSADLAKQSNIAAPHTIVLDTLKMIPYPQIDNIAPAGSISSSVSDMSHWLLCQLDSGKFNGREIIPYKVIEETRKPQSIEGNSNRIFNRTNFRLYGLGWELTDYEGRRMVSHTGGVNGFVTSVTLIPQERLGVVVFTNTDANYLFEALKWEIIDAFLNLPYRNYSRVFLTSFNRSTEKDLSLWKAQRDTVKMHLRPATDIGNYAGHYIHPVYGYLDIIPAGDKLKITFEHHPLLTGTLECLGGNRFLCTYSDPGFGIKVLSFGMENNKVKSMVLRVADFVEFTTYTFDKN